MKKKIKIEESKYITTERHITVNFPVFYIDKYGYTCHSADGEKTIEIGLNGVQSNPKDTHSIKVRSYFDAEGYDNRKKDISISQWRDALQTVSKQVTKFIDETN